MEEIAAVVLAAGEGSRLREDFPFTAKSLIKLKGKPLIYYPVREFYNFGIRKFIIVVSPGIQECIAVLEKLFPDARFFPSFQKKALGTAHALATAEKLTRQNLFYMTYCDNVGQFKLAAMSKKFKESPCLGCLQISQSKENPATARVLTEKAFVKKVYEKCSNKPAGTGRLVPVFLFSSHIYRYLNRIELSCRGEYEMADALNIAIEEGQKITYIENNSKRFNLNNLEDYKKCLKFLENPGHWE